MVSVGHFKVFILLCINICGFVPLQLCEHVLLSKVLKLAPCLIGLEELRTMSPRSFALKGLILSIKMRNHFVA
jgi:hypothetical protein